MKTLNLLFKKLEFTNFFFILFFVPLFCLILSCTLRDDTLSQDLSENSSLISNQGDVECLNLKSSLETPLGKLPVHLHLDLEKNKAFLSLDKNTFEFPSNKAPSFICRGEKAAYNFFTSLLEKTVPACQVSYNGKNFICSIAHKSAEENLEHIKKIKLALLRQSKRVPYLLSRRLTLAENLAVILKQSRWEDGLEGFCGVMEASLAPEKPIILSSKQWRDGMCQRGTKQERYQTALIILTKCVEEIAFMHVLQDKVNLAGNLLVRVQTTMLPASGKVWVKLEPSSVTIANVLGAAQEVRGMQNPLLFVPKVYRRKGQSKKNSSSTQQIQSVTQQHLSSVQQNPRVCWFPGFSPKESLFKPGRSIRLWGHNDGSPCVQDQNKVELESIAHYYIETISAETTFELSETNTKALSLPAGPYRYSVYEFPDKLGAKLQNNLIHEGLIVWNGSQQGLNVAKANP